MAAMTAREVAILQNNGIFMMPNMLVIVFQAAFWGA
jgi:hypothetical protein